VNEVGQIVFDTLSPSKVRMGSTKQPAMVGTQRGSSPKSESEHRTVGVGEEEGWYRRADAIRRAFTRTPADTSLPLEVMSNALAIDDGHPLALELQSLRTTISKYQVSLVLLAS
jgi:hypothetical protein